MKPTLNHNEVESVDCPLNALSRPAHPCVPIQFFYFHMTLHSIIWWHKYTDMNCR